MAERKLEIIIKAKDQASRTLNSLTGSMGSFAKAGIAAGAAAGVAGLGAGLAYSIQQAQEFEKEMSNVGALSGATSEELSKLSETAQQLGATTAFSGKEAAEGMSFLAMAGFETNEVIAAMPGLLAAASAGQVDLASTADIVSNVLSGFNLNAEESGRVADVLTATFTSTNTSLSSLGDSMKFAAPVAQQLGISLEDTAAAIGVMGDAGIQGSMAGTSLRSSLLRLAAPSGEAADLMKELGVSALDAQGEMLSLPEILANVNAGLAGLSDAERAAAMDIIIGKEAMSGFSVALDAAASGKLGELTAGLHEQGAAQKIAAQQLDNLSGQFTLAKSAINGLAVGVGSALLPTIQKMVAAFTGIISEHGPAIIAIFEKFGTQLSEVAGPSMALINDALTRIGAVLGTTTGEVSAMDLALAALKAVLDAVVIGIQAAAITMQGIAWGTEKISEAVRIAADLRSMLRTIFELALPDWLQPGGGGLGGRFDFIAEGMQKVVNAGSKFKETMGNLPIPDWLVPGSPTPLEIGLLGISSAFGQVISQGQGLGGIFANLTGLGGAGEEPPLPDTSGLTGLIGQQSSETVEAQNEVEASLGRLDQAVAVYTENSAAAFEMNFRWIGELNRQLKIMAGLLELNTANANGLRDAAAGAGIGSPSAESAMGGASRI